MINNNNNNDNNDNSERLISPEYKNSKPYTEDFVKPYFGEQREECIICSDNDAFTYKSWIKLGCDHYFHRHCINLWLEQRSTCPLCIENVYQSHRLERIRNIDYRNQLYICLLFTVLFVALLIIYLNK